jgi:hypothetical protein
VDLAVAGEGYTLGRALFKVVEARLRPQAGALGMGKGRKSAGGQGG